MDKLLVYSKLINNDKIINLAINIIFFCIMSNLIIDMVFNKNDKGEKENIKIDFKILDILKSIVILALLTPFFYLIIKFDRLLIFLTIPLIIYI